jgi:ATP-dependent protease ClpP protease subunit
MFKWKNKDMYLGIKKTINKKGNASSGTPDLSKILESVILGGGGCQPKLDLPKLDKDSNIYSDANHIYFNDEINDETCFNLCKELRTVYNDIREISNIYYNVNSIPIYLHITTNGGNIFSAFSVIDCINSLNIEVYSIVDGYVASAGTLISVACAKRYIMPNAYMLIHQLSSEIWGKMNEIEDEYSNLKKIMDHIIKHYIQKTKIKKKDLEKILKKDINWNANEALEKGLVDEIWNK